MITLGQPLAPDAATLHRLLAEIAASGRWSNRGPIATEFEHLLARDLDCASVVTAASGTSALTLALLACELPAGGEVVTTPLTFAATVQAIEAAGLTPVFAGVDPVTLTLDPEAVRAAIGPRTVAIVPVHLFGLAANPALDRIAAEAGLAVVYDAAHAYGLPGVASRGTAAAYSLHATKLLHTGEGGVVTTSSAEIAARVRRAGNFGLDGERVIGRGINGKLSEPAAALGLAVRARLAEEISARQAVRAAYQRILAASDRVRPHAPDRPRALVMEVVRCEAADQQRILTELEARSVLGRRFPALSAEGQRYAAVPLIGAGRREMDRLASERIALPLHGRVTEQALDSIAEVAGAS